MAKLTKDQKRKKKLLAAKKKAATALRDFNEAEKRTNSVNEAFSSEYRVPEQEHSNTIRMDGECWYGFDTPSIHAIGFMNENSLCCLTEITQTNQKSVSASLNSGCEKGQWVILPNGKENGDTAGPFLSLELARDYAMDNFPICVIRNEKGSKTAEVIDYEKLVTNLLVNTGDVQKELEKVYDLYGRNYAPLHLVDYILEALYKTPGVDDSFEKLFTDEEGYYRPLREQAILLKQHGYELHLKLFLAAAEQEGVSIDLESHSSPVRH